MKLHLTEHDLDREPWLREYIEADKTQPDAEAREWLRTRPERIRRLMVRFPLACLVRAKRPLLCPRPGTTGMVASYTEGSFDALGVTVVQEGNNCRAGCEPDWLEVVGYTGGVTPEHVELLLQVPS